MAAGEYITRAALNVNLSNASKQTEAKIPVLESALKISEENWENYGTLVSSGN